MDIFVTNRVILKGSRNDLSEKGKILSYILYQIPVFKFWGNVLTIFNPRFISELIDFDVALRRSFVH